MTAKQTASTSADLGARGARRISPQDAQAGDWIEVEGTRGAGPRRGEIVEVVGSGGQVHFRVRWDEKHESLLYPADRGYIIHARGSANVR